MAQLFTDYIAARNQVNNAVSDAMNDIKIGCYYEVYIPPEDGNPPSTVMFIKVTEKTGISDSNDNVYDFSISGPGLTVSFTEIDGDYRPTTVIYDSNLTIGYILSSKTSAPYDGYEINEIDYKVITDILGTAESLAKYGK